MFPKVNLTGAISKANELMNGVPDSFEGVSGAAAKIGINRQFVDDIYDKYGKTMQARAICGLIGTTPEALKADAERIVGGAGGTHTTKVNSNANTQSTKKFPRLK